MNLYCMICHIDLLNFMISEYYCTVISYFKIYIYCEYPILLDCDILCVCATYMIFVTLIVNMTTTHN